MGKGFAYTLVAIGATACVALFALNSSSSAPIALYNTSNVIDEAEQEFFRYIAKYRKSYGTREEYNFRLGHFRKAYNAVNEHNS